MPDKTIRNNQRKKNPFTPEFGKIPAYFAGRDDILSDLLEVLDDKSLNVCSVFIGTRGTGKTALLSYIGNEAEQLGWIKADVTAIPGMLDDIYQRAEESAAHLIDTEKKKYVDGLSIAGIGSVHWKNESGNQPNWRTQMNALLEDLKKINVGLLITVDEVDVDLAEMTELISTFQHFVREGKVVGLLMAGLPYNISSLLSGKSTSFLRRAQRFDLGLLSDYEVEEAFKLTIENGGRSIVPEALKKAVEIIGGFPFLFQLLGYRAWRMHPDSAVITIDDIEAGAEIARAEMADRIFDLTYSELSRADRNFLLAMIPDINESRRSDLMKRLDKPSAHISIYKKRLIQAGLIEETIEGGLKFAMPGFKEYLSQRQNF